MIFICKAPPKTTKNTRETLEAYESPNAPRTIKTTVFKSCYTVNEKPECYFNLATHTHTQNSTP